MRITVLPIGRARASGGFRALAQPPAFVIAGLDLRLSD
jgi:hypothetical protein